MKNSNALEMLRTKLKDNILLPEQTAAIKGGCWGWLILHTVDKVVLFKQSKIINPYANRH